MKRAREHGPRQGETDERKHCKDRPRSGTRISRSHSHIRELGIDYCCRGSKSLEEVCIASNLSVEHELDSIELADQIADANRKDRNCQAKPLADLIADIKSTHHKYTHEESARLNPLFDKVCSVHGKNHPELRLVKQPRNRCAQKQPNCDNYKNESSRFHK